MKVGGMRFDMRLDRNKTLVDEFRRRFIGVGFGFQPNAPASRGSGAKIN
jgi:hypothetical protein